MGDKHVLIGGGSDGRRVETDGKPMLRVRRVTARGVSSDAYEREYLHTPDGVVAFYRHVDLPIAEAVKRLVDSYRVPADGLANVGLGSALARYFTIVIAVYLCGAFAVGAALVGLLWLLFG